MNIDIYAYDSTADYALETFNVELIKNRPCDDAQSTFLYLLRSYCIVGGHLSMSKIEGLEFYQITLRCKLSYSTMHAIRINKCISSSFDCTP